MPRRKATAIQDDGIENVSLPGMPQDPPPKRGPGRPRKAAAPPRDKATGRITSVAAMKQSAIAQLHAMASMALGVLSMKDDCAGMMFEEVDLPGIGRKERLEALIERVVEILAKSPKALELVANSGILADGAIFGIILMPVIKQVWSAHGPGGHRHGYSEEMNPEEVSARYPAPQLA